MLMRESSAAGTLLLAAALSWPSLAAAQGKPEGNRYSMQPVEGGVVRMDNATGEMSLCHVEAKKMACDMASDQRSALQERIDRLEERVARLEGRLRDQGTEAAPLPTDKDLDRAMNTFERVMRRFFRMVDNLNRDFRQHPGPEGGSDARPENRKGDFRSAI